MTISITSINRAQATRRTFDVLVYGGSSSGVAAAVAAARAGKTVGLISAWSFVGGMTASGLGQIDVGTESTVGGISREFFQSVKKKYDDPTNWKFQASSDFAAYSAASDVIWKLEPSIARSVFNEMLSAAGVTVYLNERLAETNGITKAGTAITKIRTESGKEFSSTVFIDASYTGDLLAAAGCTFAVGREASSVYSESAAGVQTTLATMHQFTSDIDPYITPGVPSSGIAYGIRDGGPPPVDGTGDSRVQAYNFRICLTTYAPNRVLFAQPSDYDASRYTLLSRWIASGVHDTIDNMVAVPNRKYDYNNNGPFSSDFIGNSDAYPLALYSQRATIAAAHKSYLQGLFWFLSHDSSVPSSMRSVWASLGYAADEFTDNGNFPPLIYEREARRLVGMYVQTQADCAGTRTPPMSIGKGSYGMDSHNVQRYVDSRGYVKNEGNIAVPALAGYPISYQSLCPLQSECSNLLVSWAVSASHVAFSSIRMEPVGMIMGHAAGAAAAMALTAGCAVQQVNYTGLRQTLVSSGQLV